MKSIFNQIKSSAPLVHCITNAVSINDVANGILAVGGSPIMGEDPLESAEITAQSQALVINLGMLSERKLEAMILSGKVANQQGIPVILDPVGCSFTEFRRKAARRLLDEISLTIIKGNLSESLWISGREGVAKGVESKSQGKTSPQTMEKIVRTIAEQYQCIAIITGETDWICGKNKGKYQSYSLKNGDPAMTKITGIGCMLSGILGVFVGANPKRPLASALAALGLMGIAGTKSVQLCQKKKLGIGSVKTHLINQLEQLSYKELLSDIHWKKYKSLGERMFLYAITLQEQEEEKLLKDIEQALQGGITLLQLREKNLPEEEFVKRGKLVQRMCQQYDVPLIINDNPVVAQKVGAFGVHLGQEDMDIQKARDIVGDKIIGLSTHSIEEAQQAQAMGADYIGIGAVFSTQSKVDTIALSPEEVGEIAQSVSIPAVAIGGIHRDNVSQLQGKHLAGVAVISAIFGEQNIKQAAKQMRKVLRK